MNDKREESPVKEKMSIKKPIQKDVPIGKVIDAQDADLVEQVNDNLPDDAQQGTQLTPDPNRAKEFAQVAEAYRESAQALLDIYNNMNQYRMIGLTVMVVQGELGSNTKVFLLNDGFKLSYKTDPVHGGRLTVISW